MIRVVIGSVVAAVVMTLLALIFFSSPLGHIAFHHVDAANDATTQLMLAQHLPGTGTYTVPDPNTQTGAVAFAKGPVATIHYNASGFSPTIAAAFVPGLVHMFVVALLIGAGLLGFSAQVTTFGERAQTVACFALAASGYIHLADPIWRHVDWAYAIYLFIADTIVLTAGGLVIARWFLPSAQQR